MFEVRAAAGYDHGYDAEVYPVGDEEGGTGVWRTRGAFSTACRT
jgi:hypothetical protein